MRKELRPALCAASLLFFVDAVGVVLNGEPQESLLTKLWLLLQTLCFLSWLAASMALLLAVATRMLRLGTRPIFARAPADAHALGDFAVGGLPALALWCAALYWAILSAPKHFHNLELSALLVVVCAVLLAAVLFSVAGAFAALSRRARERSKTLFIVSCLVPAVSVSLVAAGVVLWDNRTGIQQLSGWLIASSLAGVVGYVVVAFLLRSDDASTRGRRLPGVGAVLSLALGGAVLSALLPWPVIALVARSEGVSHLLVAGLRRATDFDRDGYSSLWLGGDCAAFDASVRPGALEVPRDGIDNNCTGGESQGIAVVQPPRWLPKPAAVPDKLNVLLITVETLRADRVSFLGYSRPTTPNLDTYAGSSYVFENFFATTPWTRLSIPAILSSRPPTSMHWEHPTNHPTLAPDNPWIPKIFRDAGYNTIAVLPAFAAFTNKEAIGFERGFNLYDTSTKLSYVGGTLRGFPGRKQATVVRRELERNKNRPFFMWVHLMEPHYLYERSDRAPDFGSDAEGLYASEIWEADAVVGGLLADLKRLGLDANTVVVVVGDHGEEFQEHGHSWHGGNLYQPQVHTAALMHVPGLSGRRIKEAVSHEDLGPTLLNLAGVQRDFQTMAGRNLVSLLRGERLERDHFFIERYEPLNGREFMAAIVHYPHKLIYTEDGRRYQLFDLRLDPGEKRPLAMKGEPYLTLQQQLAAFVDSARR